jgi:two-component system, cell cycle sensor histidine kinase and response regulator CckA
MATPLRILMVEDSADDAELLVRELRRAGYDPDYRCVDQADDLAEALEAEEWDVILGDYTMPRFSGTAALAMVRGRGLEVPFIFVSGTIGEDTAVDAMRAGAQDYITKGNLKRLIPAIERELKESAARRQRTQAEDKLRQLSQAVEQSANLVIITDAKGRIEYVNPQFLATMGYAAEDVIGRTPALLKPAGASPERFAELWRTVLAGGNWRGEFENLRKDGKLVAVSATVSPVKDRQGRITHFISIQEDVTHRRGMEAQLHHAQKMEAIGQLTGGLAHDFNNLLTVIIGNLELLGDDLATNPRAMRLAETSLNAGLRGAELTRQLLAFARRQSLESKVFDLNGVVAGVVELLRRTLGEHVEMRTALAPALWQAVADPTQVESALVNLAVNARDAMPDGGRLTFETMNATLDADYAAAHLDAAPGDYVMVAVADTGCGIAPEVLEHVFEPFFTTKEQGKGTGLGLSMVYGFARQSRGHVNIYSELGHGTVVRLYLPRAVDPTAAAGDANADEAAAATIDATVLLVEDNADVRATALLQLRDLGYRVIEAENAAAALELLRQERQIDLLFSDVVMPGGMNGVELAREARRLRPGIKVLLSSGFTDISGALSLRPGESGAVLSKPYRKQDLARRLQELLHG